MVNVLNGAEPQVEKLLHDIKLFTFDEHAYLESTIIINMTFTLFNPNYWSVRATLLTLWVIVGNSPVVANFLMLSGLSY